MYNPRNYSYHANSVVNQRRLRQRRYLRQRLNLYRTCHGIRTQTNDAIFLSMIIRLPPQSNIDSVYLLQIVLTRETIYKIETFRPHKSETIVQYLTIRNLRNLNLEILL
uniref:Uncharacterized protein n=1 Tax=Rhizophagus irregularis (strain DAOM 181602 / DAOM 197198 / MUCL 43194) TaxID=747089 RepID=U9T7W5_RHIID